MAANIKRYIAKLVQSGTGAPVATVLGNSYDGAISFSRNTTGDYTCHSSGGEFVLAKTVIRFQEITDAGNVIGINVSRNNDEFPTDFYFQQLLNSEAYGDNMQCFIEITTFP